MRPDPSWEHVYAVALREFGVDVDMDRLNDALRAAYRQGGYGFAGGFEPTRERSYERVRDMDQRALAELGIGPMPEAFFQRLGQLFMDAATWHVFPDVPPALTALQARGLVVGAVSNWVWELPELLHDLDLVRHFDFVAASARVGYDKPHRGIFEYALEQAGVPAEAVIHVGDHLEADVAGAREVGIEPVLIDRRGRHQPPPSDVPILGSLEELLPIVDARLA
jgi:putative hydrolase of the HAD superfamily